VPADDASPAPGLSAAAASASKCARRLGIIGAGQLARMTCEAASTLGVTTVVLAAQPADPATSAASEVLIGEATDPVALRALAAAVDVITFDHEQVDLEVLGELAHEGVVLRPGIKTLEVAVDKAEMRVRLAAAGIPVPRFHVLGPAGTNGASATVLARAITGFAGPAGWPVVVKAARGGYDGKGVWPVEDARAARVVCEAAARSALPLLVEAHVELDAELAVVVARGPDGASVAWPPVETAQIDGVCREVRYPGSLSPRVAGDATALAREVAAVTDATGVLAVELFAVGGSLLVNEIAARPHNSAHWTIEGSTTSQFENHVRAVLGLPLGDTTPSAGFVASVNVFGAASPGASDPYERLADALGVRGAHVHLYGKQWRPGRKLGHVTVCGDEAEQVRARAWAAARALGTPVPASVELDA
jgi:5-(carboxyamino)imidazole ribonucleotide synthase